MTTSSELRNKARRRLLVLSGVVIGTIAIGGAGIGLWPQTSQAVANVTVYKSPTCGCCGVWVQHLERAGYHVKTVDTNDLERKQRELKAPPDLASCHIAEVAGYVVEGHVPVSAIERLLAERPYALGLFVPGMPLGSPGMESPYGKDPFDVILVGQDGSRRVFAHIER